MAEGTRSHKKKKAISLSAGYWGGGVKTQNGRECFKWLKILKESPHNRLGGGKETQSP